MSTQRFVPPPVGIFLKMAKICNFPVKVPFQPLQRVFSTALIFFYIYPIQY